jgi:hypothetical protein
MSGFPFLGASGLWMDNLLELIPCRGLAAYVGGLPGHQFAGASLRLCWRNPDWTHRNN